MIETGVLTSDINRTWIVGNLSIYVINGHMAHQHHESDPWHKRSLNEGRDHISGGSREEYGSDPAPEIKDAYKVEERASRENISILLSCLENELDYPMMNTFFFHG